MLFSDDKITTRFCLNLILCYWVKVYIKVEYAHWKLFKWRASVRDDYMVTFRNDINMFLSQSYCIKDSWRLWSI